MKKKDYVSTATTCVFVLKKMIAYAIVLLPLASYSQFNVSGTVVDKDSKAPLQAANIVVQHSFRATTSDAKGYFEIKNLKKGTYRIKVSYLGYESFVKDVDLTESQVLRVELVSSPILEDAVIISAVRAHDKIPTAYTNIDKEEIQAINLGRDIPFILEQTPSLVTTSDAGTGVGYTGMRIRGTDMTRINLTVNGVPANDPESNEVFWVDFPDLASSIDNIQVQRGVGTSTNGASAFGASINIQTLKLNANPYAEINSTYGSFNTQKYTLLFGTGLLNNRWAFDGRLSKISSDGYIDRATSDLKSYYVSASYYAPKSIIKLIAFSGKEKTYQAWMGVPKELLLSDRTYNPYTYQNQTDNYQQDNYQLVYSKEFSKAVHLNTTLHYTKGRGYYEDYKQQRNFADYNMQDVIIGSDTIRQTDLIQQKWLDNDFYGITYSVNYKKSNIDATIGGAANKYIGYHFGKVVWAQYASNSSIDYEWYNNQGTKQEISFYGKIGYQLLKKINVYGDLQYRNINYDMKGIHDDLRNLTQQHEFSFVNPKCGMYYDISEKNKIYYSFAIANREPNRNNFQDADPGKTPKPERLFDNEFGYDYSSTRFLLNVNAFYMDYNDQLVLTGEINNVGDPIMTNVRESYRAGIEMSSSLQLWKKFRWDVNATYSQNKIIKFTEYVDDWDTWSQRKTYLGQTDLAFSPNVVASSIFSYQLFKQATIKLQEKYVGDQYIDNTSNSDRKLDAYFINNLYLEYSFKLKWFKEVGLNFAINNLFNAKYETNAWVYQYYEQGEHKVMDGYFPQAGTNYLIGLKMKW